MICVYKITSPTNKVYVGSTVNVDARWRKYKKLQCISQRKLYSSLLKYGVENHIFEIITECDLNNLLRLETHWGVFYNVLDKNAGLNLMLPKDGDVYGGNAKEKIIYKCTGRSPWNKGIPMTEEMKKRMSILHSGKPAWNKGIPCTEEAKLNISIKKKGQKSPNKGIKCSDEVKKRISESKKGCIAWNKGNITGEIANNAKTLLCVQTGIFYDSILKASNAYGIKRTTLNAMLSGQNINKTPLRYV